MISPHSLLSQQGEAAHGSLPSTRQANAMRDAALVLMFNGGDEASFVEIMGRHKKRIFALALSVLRNPSDAEEIVQDTFVRAYHGLASFRGDASLASWLHRIAMNLSCNRYWYFVRRRRHASRSIDIAFDNDGGLTMSDLLVADGPDPARMTAHREFVVLVKVCMLGLSTRQREILDLRNIKDLSYQDISTLLGVTIGTVKSRISSARVRLKCKLAMSYNGTHEEAVVGGRWFETPRIRCGAAVLKH